MLPTMTELVERLQRENAELREENRLLRQKIDLLVRRVFGKKSEALNAAQLQLLLAGMEDDDAPGQPPASAPEPSAEAVSKSPKAHTRRPRLPEHLPVIEQVLDPEPVMACPEAWRLIGQEVSDQLDYEPGRFLRRRIIRRKYVKRSNSDQPPIIAALPARLIERGLMGPGLLAHILISKYADHIPLYRQQQIYWQRHAVGIPRQSLCRAVELIAEWLAPIVRQMAQEQFTGGYVQVDETPIRYLQPGAGKTIQGYLWTVHVPGGDTVYHWHPGRGHECLKTIIPESFSGTIQCDGYIAYRTFADTREGVELSGCWAHVRRKFFEAAEQRDAPIRAAWVLRQIAQLYGIEKQLRQSRAGPRLREALRQSQSQWIVQRLQRALITFKASGQHLPKSLFGGAIEYALGQWPNLTGWLADGRLEIDNNLVENAIRPTAVGKKNWLFIGAKEAGRHAAVIFSIITSCRNRGIDPHAYLRDVLDRLPSMTNHQIPGITPAAWAAARSSSMRQAS
jgi:transposase